MGAKRRDASLRPANDYRRGYMTWNLYGYDQPALLDAEQVERLVQPKVLPPVPKAVRKSAIAEDLPTPLKYTDDILPEPKPEPPKLKEFNKKLINSELSKISDSLGSIFTNLELVSQQMTQEDADDVYDFHHCYKSMCSLYAEWNRVKDCLNKELELSLPISKPAV
jgi:hypothetical protein